MSTDYAPATFISTSHYWKGRSGHTPKWIIVHGTAGGTSASAVGNYFKTNDPPTSTHFVVGLNGEVVQCVSEADSAWGNGIVTKGHDAWWSTKVNPNFLTFSIEHVKPSTSNSSQLTAAQKAASFKLIQHLCDKHNIPKKRADANGGITGHYSVDPVNKSFCPGPYPWDELIAFLNGQEVPTTVATAGVPKGWKDDGKKLTAPNGKQVVLGFRWYVLNNKWDAEDWPLENEHAATVVDITNPNPKSGTVQYFRKNVLVWEKSTNNMYAAWAGSLALAWEKRAESAPSTNNIMMSNPSASASSDAGVGSGGGDLGTLAYVPPVAASAAAVAASASRVTTAVAASNDPVSQRLAGLEQQLQTLVQQFAGNPSSGTLVQDLEESAGDLMDPKKRSKLFSDPSKLLRWFLMILGLLFSDAVAWVVSAIAHHQMSLPIPFLTVGAVGAFLSFLGAFRIPRL